MPTLGRNDKKRIKAGGPKLGNKSSSSSTSAASGTISSSFPSLSVQSVATNKSERRPRPFSFLSDMSIFPILLALFAFRSLSTLFTPILDPSETYQYVEPLHNMLYGSGLQPWDYTPFAALRSYLFLLLHAIITSSCGFFGIHMAYGKVGSYMCLRLALALWSSLCQAVLIKCIARRFGEKSARMLFFIMLFSTGFTHSSHAILPQSFCMNILMLVYAAWLSATNVASVGNTTSLYNLICSHVTNHWQHFHGLVPSSSTAPATASSTTTTTPHNTLSSSNSISPNSSNDESSCSTPRPSALLSLRSLLTTAYPRQISLSFYDMLRAVLPWTVPPTTVSMLPPTSSSGVTITANGSLIPSANPAASSSGGSSPYAHTLNLTANSLAMGLNASRKELMASLAAAAANSKFDLASATSTDHQSNGNVPIVANISSGIRGDHLTAANSVHGSYPTYNNSHHNNSIVTTQHHEDTSQLLTPPALSTLSSQLLVPRTHQPTVLPSAIATALHFDTLTPLSHEFYSLQYWLSLVQLVVICGIVGWPFTLVFLFPVIVSLFDCYLHITPRSIFCWAMLREKTFVHIFAPCLRFVMQFVPFSWPRELAFTFIYGNIYHPQYIVDIFFYKMRPIFLSGDYFGGMFFTSSHNLPPYIKGFDTAAYVSPSDEQSSSSINTLASLDSETTVPTSSYGCCLFSNKLTSGYLSDKPPTPAEREASANRHRIFAFVMAFSLFFSAFIALLSLLADRYYYGYWTLSTLNIVVYFLNVISTHLSLLLAPQQLIALFFSLFDRIIAFTSFSDSDSTSFSYTAGFKPVSFYLKNLFLNFNIALPFAMLFIIVASTVTTGVILLGRYRFTALILFLFPNVACVYGPKKHDKNAPSTMTQSSTSSNGNSGSITASGPINSHSNRRRHSFHQHEVALTPTPARPSSSSSSSSSAQSIISTNTSLNQTNSTVLPPPSSTPPLPSLAPTPEYLYSSPFTAKHPQHHRVSSDCVDSSLPTNWISTANHQTRPSHFTTPASASREPTTPSLPSPTALKSLSSSIHKKTEPTDFHTTASPPPRGYTHIDLLQPTWFSVHAPILNHFASPPLLRNHPPIFYRVYAMLCRIETRLYVLLPLLLWCLVSFSLPHKEERFLYIAYPALCIAAAFGLELFLDFVVYFDTLVRTLSWSRWIFWRPATSSPPIPLDHVFAQSTQLHCPCCLVDHAFHVNPMVLPQPDVKIASVGDSAAVAPVVTTPAISPSRSDHHQTMSTSSVECENMSSIGDDEEEPILYSTPQHSHKQYNRHKSNPHVLVTSPHVVLSHEEREEDEFRLQSSVIASQQSQLMLRPFAQPSQNSPSQQHPQQLSVRSKNQSSSFSLDHNRTSLVEDFLPETDISPPSPVLQSSTSPKQQIRRPTTATNPSPVRQFDILTNTLGKSPPPTRPQSSSSRPSHHHSLISQDDNANDEDEDNSEESAMPQLDFPSTDVTVDPNDGNGGNSVLRFPFAVPLPSLQSVSDLTAGLAEATSAGMESMLDQTSRALQQAPLPTTFLAAAAAATSSSSSSVSSSPSIFAALWRTLGYLLYLPTASLDSVRYLALAHSVRRPHRTYYGVVYAIVAIFAVVYMAISVSRNFVLIFGYSAPSITFFKLYASISSDVPFSSLETSHLPTVDSVFTFNSLSTADYVDRLFTARMTNYKQALEQYHVHEVSCQLSVPFPVDQDTLLQRLDLSKAQTSDSVTRQSNTASIDSTLGLFSNNNNNINAGSRLPQPPSVSSPASSLGVTTTQAATAPTPPLPASASDQNLSAADAANRSLLTNTYRDMMQNSRYIHPCFLAHLRSYFAWQTVVTKTRESENVYSPHSTDATSALYAQRSNTPDSLWTRTESTAYFPSQLSMCLQHYTNMARSPNTSLLPPRSLNLPLNLGNSLGSQPLNWALHSLVLYADGFFSAPLTVTTNSSNFSSSSPQQRSIIRPDIVKPFRPRVFPRDIPLRGVNTGPNPYSLINSHTQAVLPLTPAHSESKLRTLVEAATTVKVCIGSAWRLMPSSFFLPEALWLHTDSLKTIAEQSRFVWPDPFGRNESLPPANFLASLSSNQLNLGNFTYNYPPDPNHIIYHSHISGTGLGTVVGNHILVRPAFEIAFLPSVDTAGLLPQSFTSPVVGLNGRNYTDPFVHRQINPDESPYFAHDAFFQAMSPVEQQTFYQYHNRAGVVSPNTSIYPPNFNAHNIPDSTRQVPHIAFCDFIIDSDSTGTVGDLHDHNAAASKKTSHAPYSLFFDLVHSTRILDRSSSPPESRTFFQGWNWSHKNTFRPYNLWKKSPTLATLSPVEAIALVQAKQSKNSAP